MHLYQVLAAHVDGWRSTGFPHQDYPAIAEVLEWAANPEGPGFRLRLPQVRALETYWYLRLVADTPHILDLYRSLFPKTTDLLAALGLTHDDIRSYVLDNGMAALFERIKADDDFVRQFRLEALRETLSLAYPSYILALAMGAGKTLLIGSVFATEFAMAMEYPDGPFVQNALVFAPGKTIIESLRQLAETRFDRILPPRMYTPFAASVKLTFTRDGERDIPIIRTSRYNVVVTNTEKIRIQKALLGPLYAEQRADEARAEIANLRLQAIASLPHLAVFSDEAHHTYGQSLDTELKKVRKTVDYLAANTNVVCVVNTTGTPYFQKQPLRDVVVWYGLSQGIRDGILKEVAGNIQAFDFEWDVAAYVKHVVGDFFKDYGTVTLPDGTPAKLAIFFPQTNDVTELRPAIETRLAELGLPPTLILEHHTSHEAKADFDRFKFRDSPHRVALLVDRGVEGWDVPCLFACALARKLKSSNNFVLQAASRCLRQVPGNTTKARIYLSLDNVTILDKQLQETYGETIAELGATISQSRHAKIRLRKLSIPPLLVRQVLRHVVRKEGAASGAITLAEPKPGVTPVATMRLYDLAGQANAQRVLQQVSDTIVLNATPQTTGIYAAAVELSGMYHVGLWAIYDELRRIYGSDDIPVAHLPELASQIEAQTQNYELLEETVEVALALVRPDGFLKEVAADGTEVYTAEISYPVDRENLLVSWEALKTGNPVDFGFHYTSYNFDSGPERSFFEQLLAFVNLHPNQVEDIYFTGALTTPDKTDFAVDYLGEDSRWHRYTPDFIIRRTDGRALIVEIKSAQFEAATKEDLTRAEQGESVLTMEGRKAVALKRWQVLNSDRLRYELVFVKENTVGYDQTAQARQFVKEA